jgi:hypothetical protein
VQAYHELRRLPFGRQHCRLRRCSLPTPRCLGRHRSFAPDRLSIGLGRRASPFGFGHRLSGSMRLTTLTLMVTRFALTPANQPLPIHGQHRR